MRYSVICWHPQHRPCSTTCPSHNTRHTTKQQHGRTCHLSVVSFFEIWKLFHPFCRVEHHFSHKLDHDAYRCILASDLPVVIVGTDIRTNIRILFDDTLEYSEQCLTIGVIAVSESQVHICVESRQIMLSCLRCACLSSTCRSTLASRPNESKFQRCDFYQ